MEIIIYNKTKELYKSIHKSSDKSNMLRKITLTDDSSRDFTYDGELFDESIIELKESNNINENVLSDSLLNFLYDEKISGLNDENFEKHLERWLSSLKLTIYTCTYSINNVSFEGEVSYLDGFIKLSKHSKNNNYVIEKIQRNQQGRFLLGTNLITLKVKGYSNNDAKEISLNLAHYMSYVYNISIFLEYNTCSNVHIGYDPKNHIWDGLVMKDRKNYSCFDSDKNIILPAHINNICIDNSIFNSLMVILKKYSNQEQNSKIEKYILLSLGLIGKSIGSKSRNDSFVMAMSSIESLLELEKEGSIKKNISERCARIISGEDDFDENKLKIKDLYRTRCDISHGEIVYISERKLNEIIEISIQVLIFFVKKSPMIKDKYKDDDFHKYLNDILPKIGKI